MAYLLTCFVCFFFVCLQASTETEHAKVKALEIKLKEEEAKVTKLSKELETWKVCYILDVYYIVHIFSCARLVDLTYIENTVSLQELLNEEKKRGKDAEDSSVAYLDQIEALTHKLTMAESKINQYEKDSAEKGVKVKEKY